MTTKQHLTHLESTGLLRLAQTVPELEYLFRHTLVQDVAYESLLLADRKKLHSAVAKTLERLYPEDLDDLAVILAYHFEKAENFESALRYFIQAGDIATSAYANKEAEHLYRRAIEIALRLNQTDQKITTLYTALGHVLEQQGQYEEAIETYETLKDLALNINDKSMLCTAVTQLARVYSEPNSLHNPQLAQGLIEQGLQLVYEIKDPEQEVWLWWIKVLYQNHYGTPEEALATAETCISLARKYGFQDRLALVMHDLAVNLRFAGKLKKGNTYALEARKIFTALGNLPLLADNLNQQALIDFFQLDFESAFDHAREAYKLSEKIANKWNLSYSAMIQGMIYKAMGAWGEAETCLQEGITVGEDIGFLMALTYIPAEMGAILRDTGQIDLAQELHQSAYINSKHQAPFLRQSMEIQLALNAFSQDDFETGQSWLQQTQDHKDNGEIGLVFKLQYLPDALVAWANHSKQWQEALDKIDQIEADVLNRRIQLYLPNLYLKQGLCLNHLGRLQQAESKFKEALTLAKTSNLRPLIWQIYAALASLYATQGLTTKVKKERRAAVKIVNELADSLKDQSQKNSFMAQPEIQQIISERG